ncbi:MAG TPA: hypothetical protein ENH39_08635 [Gammaproteobacteria bacterium]|nr:hypothetical protein [Gammaproteobacteria bacterium]
MDVSGPQYDLKLIYGIVRKGNIVLERNADRDSKNICFFEDEVAKCLCRISPSDYYKSKTYPLENGKDIVFDIYKLECENSQQVFNELYIKLRVSSGNWVYIGSFKLK